MKRATNLDPNEEPPSLEELLEDFDPERATRQKYTDDQLIDALREFGDPPDDPPTKDAMMKHGPHAASTYHRRFGWKNALRMAGYNVPGDDA